MCSHSVLELGKPDIQSDSFDPQIEIPDVSLENFLALLEYLYTDHAPIEKSDSIGILELSNKYVIPRLMALCELYISKEVEKATAESIAQADVNVIGEYRQSHTRCATLLSSAGDFRFSSPPEHSKYDFVWTSVNGRVMSMSRGD